MNLFFKAMNYNKLWALINRDNVNKSAAGRIVDMSHQGFVSMMDRKTMTVENLEKFAHFFKVPVSYFFEYEEGSPALEAQDVVSEVYGCRGCRDKLQTIEVQKKLTDTQDRYIINLEEQLGKKQKHG